MIMDVEWSLLKVHWRNHGEAGKTHKIKQKWKQNRPEAAGHSETILRNKFVDTNDYVRKWEQSQINNSMIYLRLLEKTRPNQTSNQWKEKLMNTRAKVNGKKD